jgi:hypothetical protein
MTSTITAAVALTHFTWFAEVRKRQILRQILIDSRAGLLSAAILLKSPGKLR